MWRHTFLLLDLAGIFCQSRCWLFYNTMGDVKVVEPPCSGYINPFLVTESLYIWYYFELHGGRGELLPNHVYLRDFTFYVEVRWCWRTPTPAEWWLFQLDIDGLFQNSCPHFPKFAFTVLKRMSISFFLSIGNQSSDSLWNLPAMMDRSFVKRLFCLFKSEGFCIPHYTEYAKFIWVLGL